MKITNKKYFILFVLISVFTVSFITGCQANTPTADTKNTTLPNHEVTETGTESEAEAKPSHYEADYLPDADYGGYEFRMVTPRNGLWNLISLEADVEEETGDILYDAIYKRNRLIEEKYNIVIQGIALDSFAATLSRFQKSSQAGSDDFDLCMMIPQDAWPQALRGNVVPVNKLLYLDISQPWYVHEVNNGLSIGGKHFYVYSDECLNLFEQSFCILFNKQLVMDLGLDNMYNLVKGNKWTMDSFFGFAKAATADLDGDGIMTDIDRYGILGIGSTAYIPLWQGAGVTLVNKDKDDYHVFAGDTQKVYDVMDKIYENMCAGDKIYFDGYIDKSSHFGDYTQLQVAQNQFAKNHGLFYADSISLVPLLRAMETDFGILPLPKYNEAQQQYYTPSGKGWINCVSVSATNLERTSVVMEALAVESKNYTVPSYIEIALRTKHARDDESLEMLDIIEKTRMVDLGYSIYSPVIGEKYMNAFINKDNNFASLVEKNIGAINKAINDSNEMARELE